MYFKTRQFFGQAMLLLGVLTMMLWDTEAGVGIGIFLMSLSAYWIITSEPDSVEQPKARHVAKHKSKPN